MAFVFHSPGESSPRATFPPGCIARPTTSPSGNRVHLRHLGSCTRDECRPPRRGDRGPVRGARTRASRRRRDDRARAQPHVALEDGAPPPCGYGSLRRGLFLDRDVADLRAVRRGIVSVEVQVAVVDQGRVERAAGVARYRDADRRDGVAQRAAQAARRLLAVKYFGERAGEIVGRLGTRLAQLELADRRLNAVGLVA